MVGRERKPDVRIVGSSVECPPVRFVHPPRTGGTSIGQGWDLQQPEYQRHAPPGAADFIYGTVRNPWDRVVSLYQYLHPTATFEGWVRAGLRPTFVTGSSFEVTRPCSWWLHPLSAGPWRKRADIVAARGLRNADFVVRFERRMEDLQMLGQILGREAPTEHVNATVRGPFQDYYGDETQRIVGELFAEDVELYGYEFG